ncbi:universal stress protein [Natrarchaeobaculum aegyptiacum]|uniref:UspA domain-containing protein n=1 Tax=Natrarchaeobaculum aegyptiacum TaxID=745377 RepID=A0A2Z2HWY2_9EURY|nr:universal stress protein [Natrarchaeobaculum aegyptiacum]ARS89464.1 hypothetical protein B1756_06700 [Natrarchaeobaculum aegyptiacum]
MTHVLVAMDDSDPARAALRHACEHYPHADLTVVHVSDPVDASLFTRVPDRSSSEERRDSSQSAAVFEEARAIAAGYDRELSTELFAGDPARAIVECAAETDVDHVVIGNHGRTGVSRVLLGSVAESVVRRSPVSVTVVRG